MLDTPHEDEDEDPPPLIGSAVYVLRAEPDRLGYIQLQAQDGSVFQAAIDHEAAANLILALGQFLAARQDDLDQQDAENEN